MGRAPTLVVIAQWSEIIVSEPCMRA
jgi:hypothetical protein